eukprot:scpid27877/ scgid14687/ Fibrillin-2
MHFDRVRSFQLWYCFATRALVFQNAVHMKVTVLYWSHVRSPMGCPKLHVADFDCFAISDINECETLPCHPDASCTNLSPSFQCTCNAGYTGTGLQCERVLCEVNNLPDNVVLVDVSDSLFGLASCPQTGSGLGPDGVPTSTSESILIAFESTLNVTCCPGYRLTSTSFPVCQASQTLAPPVPNCNDIDECLEGSPCHPNATCTNNVPGFHCVCNEGFSGNGTFCEDIDECSNVTLNNCDSNATCTNLNGTFQCDCNFGYSGPGTVCQALQCPAPPERSNGRFVQELDSRAPQINYSLNARLTLICDPNYEIVGIATLLCLGSVWNEDVFPSCQDVDECLLFSSASASYSGLSSGSGDGSGSASGSGLGPCSLFANCTNTIGSFFCTCQTGFSGDGFNCADIDECIAGGSHNCDANATCSNTQGSFSCSCN